MSAYIIFKSTLHYYLREKYWRSAVNLCSDELKKGKDPYVTFWRSFGYFMEGSIIDAIRDCDIIQNNKDFKFSAINALIHYHRNYAMADTDKLTLLESKIYDIEPNANDIINCARFFWYLGENEKFDELVDKLNDHVVEDGEDFILKGWMNCYTQEESTQKMGKKLFKQYIKKFGTGNIDALLGTFKCLERLKRNSDILDSFKELSQVFSVFYPLHLEKCKIFISCGEYENAMDYIKDKLIKIPQKHFDVFKILAVCNLIHEGDFKASILSIDKMWELMVKQEAKNPELYYQTAMLFARICDRKPEILKQCETMIDKALEFAPKNSNYLNEKAYYRLLAGDMKNAFEIYSTSAQYDVNNKEASYGLIFCKILKQQYNEAQEEIEFLKEIDIGLGNPIQPRLIYYEALVKYKKGEKEEIINNLITEALNIHVKLTKTKICNKFDSLIYTNFDFLYELAKMMLINYSLNSKFSVDNLPKSVQGAGKILNLICKNKYFINAQLLYSKYQYLLGERNTAQQFMENILMTDPKNIDCYTLYILIMIDNKDYVKAKELINDAFINNLQESRSHAYFLMAKSKCEMSMNEFEASYKTLQEAIVVFENSLNDINSFVKNTIFDVKMKDRFDLYKLNVEILIRIGKTEDAQKYITKLIETFQGSNMENEILILNSNLSIQAGDVKKAVNLLKKVNNKNESIFKESRIKLAEIYLKHLMERRLYTWCYIEIIENFYSFENLKLIGNALMKINSPDEAAMYYSKALKERNDPSVIRDLGRSLIQTHDYKGAISYYKDSLKEKFQSQNIQTYYEIATDFSNLMLKLAKHDKKKYETLKEKLEGFIETLTEDVNNFNEDWVLKKRLYYFKFILSEVLTSLYFSSKKEKIEPTIISKNIEESLLLSKEVLSKVKELRDEEKINEEKEFHSNICVSLGQFYETIEQQLDFSEKAYLEALNINNLNEKALINLSNVYLKKQNISEAQKYADILLRINESSDEGIKLLISILNLKKSNDYTINYFENLLEKQPLSFKIIEVYIDVLRRFGKLNSIKQIFEKCEKKMKFTYCPGLNFCKGMFYRYNGEINKALQEFSKSKSDEIYGVKSIEQMLEIYINPDNNIMLINLENPFSKNVKEANAILPFNTKDLAKESINFLLQEMKNKRNDDRTSIYEAYVSILTKDKSLIETQISNLKEILGKTTDNIPGWVAMAMCNLVLGKQTETKNNLKFFEKASLNIKYYNEFERGLLIYAYVMMMNDNYKKATGLLQKVIEINISQVKAYDYLGMIYEAEKKYDEACEAYEKAWEYSNKSNASIGFKLATSYYNSKKAIKSINICNEIKRRFRDYPIDELAENAKNLLINS